MADYAYIVETGVIVPDTADTLAAVQAEYRTAFGDDLDVSPETPQGVLITAETEARDAVARNNADLANQINPNISGGVFLDAIWALTGGARFTATPSTLRDVVLAGVPSTIVPEGARASVGVDGVVFQLISPVILDGAGVGVGTFQSVELGAFPVSVGQLNVIVSSVLGWETVSNPAAAEEGRADEMDGASRRRRRATLALQGVALPEAIVSGLRSLPGVSSLAFRENATNASVTVEGVTLVAHSIYVCIDGGLDNDVALMLLRKKSLGCAWNGTTTVNIADPISGQVYPVKFSRPTEQQIYMRVTVGGGAPYADVPGTVRAAILAYASGQQDGEDGFTVGGDVSAFEVASAVNRAASPIFVTNLLLSTDGTTFSTATISIPISQIARVLSGNIAVTVLP